MPTIAISGASGFLGSALSARLRERGDRVRPLMRPGSAAEDGIYWDPAGGTIDQRALEGVDAIVHLAGESIAGRWTEAKKRRIRESRVRGTGLIANALAALRTKPRALVSASGINYYGDRGPEEIDESFPRGEDFLAEVVEVWEAAARPALLAGIRTAHPRFGVVLAPHGGALEKMLLPFKLGFGAKLGSGQQWMSWIALEDALSAIVRALDDAQLSGAFNACSPAPVTNEAFTRALGRALRRPTPLAIPSFAMRMAIGEMADAALLSSVRALPKRLLERGFSFAEPDLEAYLAKCFL